MPKTTKKEKQTSRVHEFLETLTRYSPKPYKIDLENLSYSALKTKLIVKWHQKEYICLKNNFSRDEQ